MEDQEIRTLPIAGRVIAFDETQDWCLGDCPYQDLIKAIQGVYFYDANERTCCCEFTPSYYLRHLENNFIFKDEVYEREDFDTIAEAVDNWKYGVYLDNPDIYVHCHTVDGMTNQVALPPSGVSYEDSSYDDQIEGFMEHERGNPHFS